MRVKLIPLADGRLALPFALELTDRTGWRVGDEVVVWVTPSKTLMMARPAQYRSEEGE